MEFTSSASLYQNISIPVLPIFETMLIILIFLPLAAVAGYYSGHFSRGRLLKTSKTVDIVTGEATLNATLALLGLLLAFSFGNALNLSQSRKSTIVDEAAALGTVFFRADYLAEPGRTELQTAILDYARTRVLDDTMRFLSKDAARTFIDTSLQAQSKLWPLTLEFTNDPMPAPIKTFIASAMNEALDSHLYRIELISTPVSDVTQAMMGAASLIALFLLGNRAGMVGRKLTWRTFVFSWFLMVVMGTIVDMQRSNEGFVRVDDTTLRVTIFDMEQSLAGRT